MSATEKDWKPEPLPPRPPPEKPSPILDPALAEEAFVDAISALRALAAMRDRMEEEKGSIQLDEMTEIYREVFRAFGEVRRLPLTAEEQAAWCTQRDAMTVYSGTRMRQAAREWTAIGQAVVERMKEGKRT